MAPTITIFIFFHFSQPSYTSWDNFSKFVNLEDMFYDENHIIFFLNHPIKKEHKEIVDKAHSEFYLKYPNCQPGYSPKSTLITSDPDWPEENSHAVRLEWLKFWIDWSLENCQNPVFFND